LESNSWEDPVTQLLFQIAEDFLERSIKRETEILDTIASICHIAIYHYERINTAKRMQYNSPSLQAAISEIQRLQQVKRCFKEVTTEEPSNDATVGKSAGEKRYENSVELSKNIYQFASA
jgi:hypothetical protein